MSFIFDTGSELQSGNAAAQAFRLIVGGLIELEEESGLSLSNAVKKLAQMDLGEDLANSLVVAIKQWVARNGQEPLSDLLSSLREIELRQAHIDRQLGWPARTWTKTPSVGPVAIELNADVGAYFEILADNPTLPRNLLPLGNHEAAAKLVLQGQLDSSADVAARLLQFGLSADGELGLSRRISSYYRYRSHDTKAGLALAGALSELRNPAEFDQMMNLFQETSQAACLGVVVEGDAYIGGSMEVQAAFPTQYGTFGFMLGGEAKTSRGFTYTVTSNERSDGLIVAASSNSSFTNQFEFGASYSVGLSTISPAAAQAILSHAKGLADSLEMIDEKFQSLSGRLETWLKPGSLIKTKIDERLYALLMPALDADGSNRTEALAVAKALAGILGFQEPLGTPTADTMKRISAGISNIIGTIVDDTLGILDRDGRALKAHLMQVTSSLVEGRISAILASNVYEKIVPDLNEQLEAVADQLDESTKSAIANFLGQSPESGLRQISNFIERARSLAAKVIDGIASAQTELLAAELAWHHQRAVDLGFDYKVGFLQNSDDAKQAYELAVKSPRNFGKLLFKGKMPEGVNVLESSTFDRLYKTKGHRWSLALIGLSLGGAARQESEIEIVNSHNGVTLLTGNNLKEEKTFLRETRTASFISAINLLEAKAAPKASGDPVGAVPEGMVDLTGQPRASASIKLHLEEIDDHLHVEGAKKLLKRFIKSDLLDEDISDAVKAAIKKAQADAGDEVIAASLSIGLAVPSIEVLKLLEAAAPPPTVFALESEAPPINFIERATIQALAEHDQVTVDEANKALAVLGQAGEIKTDLLPEPEQNLVVETSQTTLSKNIIVLTAIASLPNAVETERAHDMLLDSLDTDAIVQARRNVKKIRGAVRSLAKVLKISAEIYRTDLPDPLDSDLQNKHEELKGIIKTKQKEINKAAKKFLDPGLPGPDRIIWFGKGRASKRIVALFAALQATTKHVTSVTPPLIVTFKPKNGQAMSFISPVVDR